MRTTEQANRLLAAGDSVIKMPAGVILHTKDSLVPTDTILDQVHINAQFKNVTGRKQCHVLVPDGPHRHTLGWRVTQPGDHFTV